MPKEKENVANKIREKGKIEQKNRNI